VGYFNDAPILKFLYKGKGMTNLQGEKFSEQQMIEAVKRATEETGIHHEFFMGYADNDDLRYKLYIELTDNPPPERIDTFAKAVDKAMKAVNLEYEAKRDTARLGPLSVVPLRANSFDSYRAIRREAGTHDGQIKWMQLTSVKRVHDEIRSLALDPDSPSKDQPQKSAVG
jgi:hypothetical protein